MAKFWEVAFGAVGDAVKNVQKALNNAGSNLAVDGIFGNKTLAAVKDYQAKNNLDVDGIVGTNTWGSLVNNLTSKPSSTNSTQAPAATAPAPTAPAPAVQTTEPAKNNSNNSGSTTDWSYDPFQVSSETAAADQKRQDVASQKPGDFSYKAYEESDVVKQAQALLQQQLANKPGEYQSQWQNQLNEAMDKILNREKFSYDLNGDALYQQYKDMYTLQGQQAMMDTMGQAAAMTGGYGNSYAQTAGQQMYNSQLQQLNDKVPELYQLALNQYNQEGQDLYNQYGMYADRENQDYGRYRDTVSDYYTELNRLTDDARYQSETDYNRYMDSYNQAYGQHRDAVSDWQQEQNRADQEYWNQYNRDYSQYADDRNLAYDNYWNEKNLSYQQDRDKVADSQWQKEFDEAQRQYNESFQYQQDRDAVADSQWNQSFQYQQDRDKVSDSQWQTQFDYQKTQDQIANDQWQQSMDYQKAQDQIANDQWNQSFQYQQAQDKIANNQWQQSFQYQQSQDKIANDQWNQSFQYQQAQDKIANDQWQQSMDYQQNRDKVSDSQWQTEFDEAVRQWNHANGISSGSSSSSSSSSSSGGSKNGGSGGSGYDANTAAIQQQLRDAGYDIAVDGIWGPKTQAAYDAYQSGGDGDGDKLTYSDVALTAAQMRQQGASNNDIYQYISSVVNSSNYKPTNSAKQDLAELKSGYVGSGR